MAKRIEAATGSIETRATIARLCSGRRAPTCRTASMRPSWAPGGGAAGKRRKVTVVAYKHGEFLDFDIQEALNMKKDIRKISMRLVSC